VCLILAMNLAHEEQISKATVTLGLFGRSIASLFGCIHIGKTLVWLNCLILGRLGGKVDFPQFFTCHSLNGITAWAIRSLRRSPQFLC
jgi:hypothetical protein